MIRKLVVDAVTVFPTREVFHLVEGINVVVGGNDSGKSHLLKLSYALSHWMCEHGSRELPEKWAAEERLRQAFISTFGVQGLSSLSSRVASAGRPSLKASFSGDHVPLGSSELAFHFFGKEDAQGLSITRMPDRSLLENALFISPREVLSIFPYYTHGAKRFPELFDGVSRRLCEALSQSPLKEKPAAAIAEAKSHIESLLGGELVRQHARFYLKRPEIGLVELNLIAEGFKRLGTLALLLDNGSVRRGTMLFWDEPEMNLNASHLPALVRIMLCLCRAGVQLMLSTHSLFLLRELTIQLRENEEIARRFIGLQAPSLGHKRVRVSTADSMMELEPMDSLQAEVAQADRYLGLGVTPLERPYAEMLSDEETP